MFQPCLLTECTSSGQIHVPFYCLESRAWVKLLWSLYPPAVPVLLCTTVLLYYNGGAAYAAILQWYSAGFYLKIDTFWDLHHFVKKTNKHLIDIFIRIQHLRVLLGKQIVHIGRSRLVFSFKNNSCFHTLNEIIRIFVQGNLKWQVAILDLIRDAQHSAK